MFFLCFLVWAVAKTSQRRPVKKKRKVSPQWKQLLAIFACENIGNRRTNTFYSVPVWRAWPLRQVDP